MSDLAAIEYETTPAPDAAVIWLHGLGADGHDFFPIVPELSLPDSLGIRFIFPHAPSIPVTVNGGYVMPAWFDLLEMGLDRKVDTKQLLNSASAINALIDRETERGVESRRIILAGFSQGGAVAYQVALSNAKPLGGLLAMSTYFATHDSIQLNTINKKLPIEIFHGTQDPVVPEALGLKALDRLKDKGYPVNYHSYPMEHTVCPQQVADISSCLQTLL